MKEHIHHDTVWQPTLLYMRAEQAAAAHGITLTTARRRHLADIALSRCL